MKFILNTVLILLFTFIPVNGENKNNKDEIKPIIKSIKIDSLDNNDKKKLKKTKIVYYYNFKEYKEKVSFNETRNKYWIWQYDGGPGCGKYQMDWICRKITGYGHVTRNLFYQKGWNYWASEKKKKAVFDEVWSESDQEKAMDSLCVWMIHNLENKTGKPIDEYIQYLNTLGYPQEITDAMVLGAIHYVGLENFIRLSKTKNSYYYTSNVYGYTLWKCMLRYKNIKVKKKRIIWELIRLEPQQIKILNIQ